MKHKELNHKYFSMEDLLKLNFKSLKLISKKSKNIDTIKNISRLITISVDKENLDPSLLNGTKILVETLKKNKVFLKYLFDEKYRK